MSTLPDLKPIPLETISKELKTIISKGKKKKKTERELKTVSIVIYVFKDKTRWQNLLGINYVRKTKGI